MASNGYDSQFFEWLEENKGWLEKREQPVRVSLDAWLKVNPTPHEMIAADPAGNSE
jgi:hypothetical protein